MTEFDTATLRQIEASRPHVSTWLAANAGSGKTRVLIDRVARLLLHGAMPERILCLTFTKAAATEMQNRLILRLGEWAMMDDLSLAEQLGRLGETQSLDSGKIARARTLFARAVETPGGLKIQTIHAFCSALLRRFPLEARVSPQFVEIEERAADLLQMEVVEDIADGPRSNLVEDLAAYLSDPDFGAIANKIAANRERFLPARSRAELCVALGLPPTANKDTLLAQVFTGGEDRILKCLVDALRDGAETDRQAGRVLKDVTVPGLEALPVLERFFLTGSSAQSPFSAKIGHFPTKKLRALNDSLMASLEPFMQRVEAGRDARLALAAVDKSLALHSFADAFLQDYAYRKQMMGVLDFDDLILKTRALLNNPEVADWVLYRLDGGIDHILVDEAQDTSPGQWNIIDRLAHEFTSGLGARGDTKRTIFVVGDKKQSIYSFQGADPDGFNLMEREFGTRLANTQSRLNSLSLDHSFRSSPAVLRIVDMVFSASNGNAPLMGAGISTDTRHIAFRSDLPGRVDLWPVVESADSMDEMHWADPSDRTGIPHHTTVLAQRIAGFIRQGIEAGTTIPESGDRRRLIRPGDIMILVQRRSALFSEIIRACKAANLPIAGADRLRVGAELAVRDLTSLLRFLDMPRDDLSLAEALKSPLFGWTEQALFDLAHRRGERKPLWSALRNHRKRNSETLEVLKDLRNSIDFLRPYDLIERILTRHDGRRKLMARLGPEAEDGINALLGQALAFEKSEIPSLAGFLTWMETDNLEIKRQMGDSGDVIRVMTVHGAKGLESPIVILPDTAKRTLPDERDLVYDGNDIPFWSVVKEDRPKRLAEIHANLTRKREEENQRLLYVALTRAEKWLIVAAAGRIDKKYGNSWYQQVWTALNNSPATRMPMPGGEGLRHAFGDWTGGKMTGLLTAETREPVLPEYFRQPPPDPDPQPETVNPSDLGGAKALPGKDGLTEAEAIARGTAIHRLLEVLPGFPREERPAVAERLLSDHKPEERAKFLSEVLMLLDRPEFGEILSPETLAEVSITANLWDRRLFGTIDRLVLHEDRVLAVDFKTNAVAPASVTEVPEGLLRQMGAYAKALRQIYPGRRLETAILWTKTARLMVLPEELTNAALCRAMSDASPGLSGKPASPDHAFG